MSIGAAWAIPVIRPWCWCTGSGPPAATGATTPAPWPRRAGCVYALDLIGFGASSQPNLRLDNRLWARQLAAFLEQVVAAPAVLVGNSLGALVALSCAVWAPSGCGRWCWRPWPIPAC
jgi:pimeloyl-ACP methyl ester carboxylesterase